MHKRLFETANFHSNFDPQKQKVPRQSSRSPGTPPVGGLDDLAFDNVAAGAAATPAQEDELEYTSSREFHLMLARLVTRLFCTSLKLLFFRPNIFFLILFSS